MEDKDCYRLNLHYLDYIAPQVFVREDYYYVNQKEIHYGPHWADSQALEELNH